MRSVVSWSLLAGMLAQPVSVMAQTASSVAIEQLDARLYANGSAAAARAEPTGDVIAAELTIPDSTIARDGVCKGRSSAGQAQTDCPSIVRADPRLTPEGTLLNLLGKSSWVTQRSEVRGDPGNADVIAQDIARGDFRGSAGQAAAVAAGQRTAPQSR
jgi:hypothetical protein